MTPLEAFTKLYDLKQKAKQELQKETAEKEVQDTSCRGSGGVPQLYKVPQDWGIRGLIKTIPAFSLINTLN